VSADRRIVAGDCSFDGSPFRATVLVWMPTTDVVDLNPFFQDNGVRLADRSFL